MGPKWSWVTGIATLLGLGLSVVFFVSTQAVSNRDWIVLFIGILIGAAAAAFVGTFVFHSNARAAKKTAAADQAQAEVEALKQQAQKKSDMIALIPTKRDRLEELYAQKLQLEIDVSNSEGYAAIGMTQARDAARHGFTDMALENQTNAKSWKLARESQAAEVKRCEDEISRVDLLTAEQWKAEQVRQRLIDAGDLDADA